MKKLSHQVRTLLEMELIQAHGFSSDYLNRLCLQFPELPLEHLLIQKKIFTPEKLQNILYTLRERAQNRTHIEQNIGNAEKTFLKMPPKKIGHYEILEKLAQGGMGIVYKARHQHLQHICALKVILHSQEISAEMLTRFHRESQMVARLKHPGIVQVLDSGQEAEQHYFVMEYVEGKTFEHWMREKKTLKAQLEIFQKILESLHYAHQEGIIHRDLKPANIFITNDGFPKIGDFGLAKEIRSPEIQRLTKSGEIMGTPAYMSPEQLLGGQKISFATDIYAMGICFYQLLTQQIPFEGKTIHELFYAIIHENIPPPSSIKKKLPRDLETIALKALRKEPEKRYTSAKAFAQDIERFLNGYPILARPISFHEYAFKWLKRHQQFCLILLFLGLGLGLFFSAYQWKRGRSDHQILQEQQERFQFWVRKIQESAFLSEKEQEDAVFEISKMSTNAIFQPLIAYLKEGTTSLLGETSQKTNAKYRLYLTCIRVLGRLGHSEAIPLLMEQLETIGAQISKIPPKKRAISDVKYMATLAQALGDLNAQTMRNRLEQVRLQMGRETLFWNDTQATILKLNSQALSLEEDISDLLDPSFLKKTKLYKNREELEQAMVLVNKAIKLYPKQVEFYIHRGALLMKLGDYTKALENFQEAIIQNPTFPAIYFVRADCYLQMKEWKKALEDYDYAIELKPDDAEFYYNRANLKEEFGNFYEALKDYNKSIELNPEFILAYQNRAYLKQKQGKHQEALQDFDRIIELAPQESLHYFHRGILYATIGQTQKALMDYGRSIQLNPQHEEAYNNRANLKSYLGDEDGALADLNHLLFLNPNYGLALVNRGNIFLKQGRLQEALFDYNQALKFYPNEAIIYYQRALLQQKLGQISQAIQDLKMAIKLNPQFFQARQLLQQFEKNK